jgi:hypothetical protein
MLHVLAAGGVLVVPGRCRRRWPKAGRALEEALADDEAADAALVDDTTRRLGAADAAIFKAQAELLNG